MLQQSTTVINTPDIFFVGYTHNPTKKRIPSLDKECVIEINNCTYRISGIVYFKSHHYWCEVYSTQKQCKSGWFVYNGLWNNRKATFVGQRPLFMEKKSLYLMMFEKSCLTIVQTILVFQHSINQLIVITIKKHENLLSLSDNKVKLDNIKAILLYHNIAKPPNMKPKRKLQAS